MAKKNWKKSQSQNLKDRCDKSNTKSKKDKSKGDMDEMDKKMSSYDNDSSWYAPTDELLSEVNTFTFDNTIGVPIRTYVHTEDGTSKAISHVFGTIMAISTFPSIGRTNKAGFINAYKSAVAAAAQKAYTILSSSNGKTTKYLPEDIALVILMLGNIIEMVATYWRLYGTQFMYNPRNRLVPNVLIDAQGFKHQDYLTKIANSRARFNSLMARLDGVSMFADIDYFKKCWEMNNHIFYDKNSAMGQIYVMKPAGWFRYVDGNYNPETGYFEGNKLYYEEWAGLMEIDDFLDILENQINDMLNSELFNLVYSDVIREITKNGGTYYAFGTIPEMYTFPLEFSETFMTQVHNMTWGFFKSLSGYEITDDVENLDLKDNLLPITLDPTTIDMALLGPSTLDFPYTDKPDYKLIADALAFKTGADYIYTSGDNLGKCVVCAVPDHPVYKVQVYFVNATGDIGTYDLAYNPDLTYLASYDASGFLNFDIRPVFKVSVDDTFTARPVGELNYFTQIEPEKLMNVFEFAFLKLFDPKLRGGNR